MNIKQIRYKDKNIDMPYQKHDQGIYYLTGLDKIKKSHLNMFLLNNKSSYRNVYDVNGGVLVIIYSVIFLTKKVDGESIIYKHAENGGAILFTKEADRNLIYDTYQIIDNGTGKKILQYFNKKY